MPGDTLNFYTTALPIVVSGSTTVTISIPLNKSTAFISKVTATFNNGVSSTFGFLATTSGVQSINPRLAENQTVTGTINGSVANFAFKAASGDMSTNLYATGVLKVNMAVSFS